MSATDLALYDDDGDDVDDDDNGDDDSEPISPLVYLSSLCNFTSVNGVSC